MSMRVFLLVLLGCVMMRGPVNAQEPVSSPKPVVPELTKRQDERRPADQLTLPLFGRPLTIGGELTTTWSYRQNFDVDKQTTDDLVRQEQELQVEFSYHLAPNALLFLEGKASYLLELYKSDGPGELEWSGDRGQMWLYLSNLFGSGVSLKIGRQSVEETREWWWEEDLDAVRLFYERPTLQMELGIAQELTSTSTAESRLSPEDNRVLRSFGRVTWEWTKRQRLEGFLLHQYDYSRRYTKGELVQEDQEDAVDANLLWFGARAIGRVKFAERGDLNYWFDSAGVLGNATEFAFNDVKKHRLRVKTPNKRKVNGWAIDLGASWRTLLPWRPAFTLAYAMGSGDPRPEDGIDHAFRQTGIQGNSNRFFGVNRFRYYGELLRPELSNLHIWTAAVGVRPWEETSIELVYHLYRQVHAVDFLRDARLDADPEGKHFTIGQEWDLVLGVRQWEHVDLELVGSIFRTGSAYGKLSGSLAYAISFELSVNF